MWLVGRVKIGCDIATPKQVSIRELIMMGGEKKGTLEEDMITQLHRPIQEPIHNISCSSAASQHYIKCQCLAYFARIWIIPKRGRSYLNNGYSRSKV